MCRRPMCRPLRHAGQSFITPTELFYCRHHHPVPLVNADEFTLNVKGRGVRDLNLTVAELKKLFAKRTVVVTMQCAGNRRATPWIP